MNFKGNKVGGGGIPIVSSCGTRETALVDNGIQNLEGRSSVLPRGASPLHQSLELEKLLRQGVTASATKPRPLTHGFGPPKKTSYGNLRSGVGCFSAKNSNAANAL